MKSFLEEYGFAILGAIVVILIIAMCTPVGNLIKKQVMNVVDSFAGKTESRLAAANQHEEGVFIKQSDIGKIKVTINSNSTTDNFDVEYRVKADKSAWGNWNALDPLIDNKAKSHEKEYSIEAYDGYSIQVRAKDKGKNDKHFMESNVIKYKGDFVASDPSSQANAQAIINEMKANLKEDEYLDIINANGAVWPNGETMMAVVYRRGEAGFIKAFPEGFDDLNDFYDYSYQISRDGYTLGEENWVEDDNDSRISYWNMEWTKDVELEEHQVLVNFEITKNNTMKKESAIYEVTETSCSPNVSMMGFDLGFSLMASNPNATSNPDTNCYNINFVPSELGDDPMANLYVGDFNFDPYFFTDDELLKQIYDGEIKKLDVIVTPIRSAYIDMNEYVGYTTSQFESAIRDLSLVPRHILSYDDFSDTIAKGSVIFHSSGGFNNGAYVNYGVSKGPMQTVSIAQNAYVGYTVSQFVSTMNSLGLRASHNSALDSSSSSIAEGIVIVHESGTFESDDYVEYGLSLGEEKLYWGAFGAHLLLSSKPFPNNNYDYSGSISIEETATSVPWKHNIMNALDEVIDQVTVLEEIKPLSTSGWFDGMYNLHTADLRKLNTENVTDMSYMFAYANNLMTVNVSNLWTTENVANSTNMFLGCTSIYGNIHYNASYVDKTYATTTGSTYFKVS